MRIFLSVIISLGFALNSVDAHAQYMGVNAGIYAGAGLYGGAQGCPYGGAGGGQIPEGLAEVEDEIEDLKQQKQEAKDDLKDAEEDLKDIDEDIKRAEEYIDGVLKPHVAQGVKTYVRTPPADLSPGRFRPENVCGGGTPEPWPGFCTGGGTPDPQGVVGGYTNEAMNWDQQLIRGEPGKVDGQICSGQWSFVRDDKLTAAHSYQRGKCSESVTKLYDLYQKKIFLTAKRDNAKAMMDNIDDQLKDKRREKKRVVRDAKKTEADYCYTCVHKYDQPISTTQKVGSLLLGGLGAYLGYKGYKHAVNTAADLGWPMSGGSVLGAVMPSVMWGIYGATYGGSNYACAGYPSGPYGMYGPGGLYGSGLYPNAGGAFGYPQGWGGLAGGGMFMPGMYPGGYPYGGGYGGVPWSGFPVAGGFAGGIAGAMAGMPYMGSYAGMPYMGGTIAGGIAGGIAGAIAGMPYAGGYAGIPYAGMPYAGMPYMGGGAIVGGIAGAIAGFPAAGIPYAGIAGYAGMAGFPAAGMGLQGQFGLQYQQLLMQQQQQQMQIWMAQQQDAMNRQQLVGRLTGQLYQIQMQIQQISSGAYLGGYGSGSPSILPYPGSGGSPSILPYPGTGGSYGSYYDPNLGNTTSSNTPLPSRGGR